jgi:hypothetical protein
MERIITAAGRDSSVHVPPSRSFSQKVAIPVPQTMTILRLDGGTPEELKSPIKAEDVDMSEPKEEKKALFKTRSGSK